MEKVGITLRRMRGINIAEGSKNISSRMISVKKFSNSFQSAHYSPLMVEIYILKSVKTIDGCQSFTHVSILIELKDQQKCSTVSQNVSMISPWWFLMSQFSDELSARLANIRKYDHECVKMCPGLRDCHETPPDMWHYTGAGVASVTVSCVLACVHNQLPLSPAQPQVDRKNILWEQGSLESRDLTVGVLIKLN